MRRVYTIIDSKEPGGKNFFCQIGACFDNKDYSNNIVLNALPINGKIWIESQESAEKHEQEKEIKALPVSRQRK